MSVKRILRATGSALWRSNKARKLAGAAATAVAGDIIGGAAVSKVKAVSAARKEAKRFEIYNKSPAYRENSARLQGQLSKGISKIYRQSQKKRR